MKKLLQRGFTLIELLVVIAIIGILAAVVLASLNDARDSGQDAAIKESLGNARAQGEVYYNQNDFSYVGVCDSTQMTALLNATLSNRAETTTVNTDIAVGSDGTSVTCHADVTGFAVLAPLNATSTGQAWCVDNTGYSGEVASVGALVTDDVTCQ